MGKRDSNHTAPEPRWGMTTGETVDSDVIEPADAKKDIGWNPGEKPPAEWFNWVLWAAYMRVAYFASMIGKRWTLNHVMRNGKVANAGAVTAGAGLSVNVSLSRVWIEGAMYEVPAAVNLALAAADPTNPRNDLVVAQLTLGVPSYAIVTGTPAATPADPALASDEVAMARVRVSALAVVPGTITSLRQYGALGLDHLEVDDTFHLGDLGGGDYLIEGNAGGNGLLRLAGGLLTVNATTGKLEVEPEALNFPAAIRRKYDIGLSGISVSDPSTMIVSRTNGVAPGRWLDGAQGLPAQQVFADVRIPNGATITKVRVYGNRSATDRGFEVTFVSYEKGSAQWTTLVTGDNTGSGSAGDFTYELTLGVPHAVNQSKLYELIIEYKGAGALKLYGAEVEWEETKPFDGI